jgi:hypothetical protein
MISVLPGSVVAGDIITVTWSAFAAQDVGSNWQLRRVTDFDGDGSCCGGFGLPVTTTAGNNSVGVNPLPPGDYNVRLFTASGGTAIATSNTLTIELIPTLTPTPPVVPAGTPTLPPFIDLGNGWGVQPLPRANVNCFVRGEAPADRGPRQQVDCKSGTPIPQ